MNRNGKKMEFAYYQRKPMCFTLEFLRKERKKTAFFSHVSHEKLHFNFVQAMKKKDDEHGKNPEIELQHDRIAEKNESF